MKKLNILLKLSVISLSFLLILYVLKILAILGPAELRENSILLNTDLLIKGINPYSLSVVPLYTNVYGILYHLVVYPFAIVFGNSYIIHRLTSLFFYLISLFYFYKILRYKKISKIYSVVASLFLAFQILFWGYDLLARPDSLGFFLFLLSVFIPLKNNFKLKSVFLGLILSVISYLAKPYFIFSSFLIISYLLFFVSFKRAIISGTFFGIVLLSSLLILDKLFPTYIYSTIFVHDGSLRSSAQHLYLQLQTFLLYNFSLVIVSAIYILKKKKIAIRELNYEGWCALASFFILYIKLGRHTGNFMTYFNHLFTPFILILVFGYFSKNKLQKIKKYITFVITLNIFVFCYFSYIKAPDVFGANYSWMSWSTYLDHFSSVYNSPPLATILSRQGKRVYDTGQTEFFREGINDSRIYGVLKNANAIEKQYEEKVNQMVKNKEFDLVVTTQYAPLFFNPQTLKDNYTLKETKEMVMFKDSYEAQVWYPK